MAKDRLSVNCLVQVRTDNRLDFEEWVDYHVALGFDTIFVCDGGNRTWLEDVCRRRTEHVVLAPRDERWQYKSEIIRDYVSRREMEEWCICLDDREFLWLSPERNRSVVDYASMIPPSAAAVTFFVKHMSSKEPMRYRVGTQIDCFVHTRREPEGFYPQYVSLPNGGITMFRVTSRNMPLRDPVTPVYSNAWVDSAFRQMTSRRYAEETASKRFAPTSYPARIYRYAIRSGDEMGFDDKMVPVGFDVEDLSMQKARERYMHVPVNPDTEKLFAKKEKPESAPTVAVEASNGKTVQVSPEKAAELKLPITKARIDKLIFQGKFFEDIAEYVAAKDPDYDRVTLERMFETERQNIIATSPLYTEMQELLDQGIDDAEIMKRLLIKETTYKHMKMALPVLGIETEYAVADEAAPEESEVKVNVGVQPESPVESAVADFEAQIEAAQPTEEELATRQEALEILDTKYKPKKASPKKKSAPKKAAKKAKVVVGSAKKVGEVAKPEEKAPEAPAEAPVEASLEGIGDSMLDEINLDAVVGSMQSAHKE